MAEWEDACVRTVFVYVCSVCNHVNERLDPNIDSDCSLAHQEIALKLIVPAQTNPRPQPSRFRSVDLGFDWFLGWGVF